MRGERIFKEIAFHPSADLSVVGRHLVGTIAQAQKSGRVTGRRLFWVERMPDRNNRHVYRVIGEVIA